jgi:hypothetical protein
MDETLRRLQDRYEIQEVIMRYCRALDRLDRKALESCFHPDSQHNHSYVGPSSTFCDFAFDVLSACVATHHQLGNISIRVQGDLAYADCYFTAYHRIGDPPPPAFAPAGPGDDVLVGGRYIDRFERRDGEWRIAKRIGVHDWRRYEAGADHGFYQLPTSDRGRRDPTDHVYSAEF